MGSVTDTVNWYFLVASNSHVGHQSPREAITLPVYLRSLGNFVPEYKLTENYAQVTPVNVYYATTLSHRQLLRHVSPPGVYHFTFHLNGF